MHRRGAILIVALVCLAVAAVLFVVLAKQAATEHRVSQSRQWAVQAQWLAEAGVERAVARLAADAAYNGETWSISAEQLASPSSAVVRIRTEAIDDQPDRRIIHVEADYPNDLQHRARQIKQITADIVRK
jgi:type II secretory pathway component PulK